MVGWSVIRKLPGNVFRRRNVAAVYFPSGYSATRMRTMSLCTVYVHSQGHTSQATGFLRPAAVENIVETYPWAPFIGVHSKPYFRSTRCPDTALDGVTVVWPTRALASVYCDSETHMDCYRYTRGLLTVAYCLLILGVAEFRPIVMGGFFKLITSIVLAYLLAFVLVHRTNIFKILAAGLKLSPMPAFSFVVNRRWAGRTPKAIAVPDPPSLSPLFQRPPPIHSI